MRTYFLTGSKDNTPKPALSSSQPANPTTVLPTPNPTLLTPPARPRTLAPLHHKPTLTMQNTADLASSNTKLFVTLTRFDGVEQDGFLNGGPSAKPPSICM